MTKDEIVSLIETMEEQEEKAKQENGEREA